MKKEFVIFLFVSLILFSAFSLALNESLNQEDLKKTAEGAAADAKKELKQLPEDIKSKTNEFLEQEVILAEPFQGISKLFLGINYEIKLDEFIILVAIWIMLFLLIHEILLITPFFSGWKSWLGAFLVTWLVSITGAIKEVSDFMYNIGDMFKFLEGQNAIKIILALLVAGIILFAMSKVLDRFKEKAEVEEAEISGMRIGLLERLSRAFSSR